MPHSQVILITGVAGFIGSHLAETLLQKGYSVIGIDNFDPYYDLALKHSNLKILQAFSEFSFLEDDICNQKLGEKLGDRRIDTIIHIAAKAGVRPSLADPRAYYEVNVNGTLNMLELAKERGIKKFLFASSSSVYGENPKRPWSEEDADLSPISPYASSKLACEQLGHVYSKHHEIQFLAMRFFTVYGPRQRPDLAIRKFIELIEAGKPIPVYGDGTTSRDYTYVLDTVAGIIQLLESENLPSFDVYNLGNEHPVTLSEMISVIGDVLGKKPEIDLLPMQPGDVSHTLADISKAKKAIGYAPNTSFQTGITQFLQWFRNQ